MLISILLVSMSLIFENSDALPGNVLNIDYKPLGKLFIQIENKKGPKREP